MFEILFEVLQVFNPFSNKPLFLRVCSTSFLKTQWEKMKLLVTSNFSFSHSVFYPFGELFVILIEFEIVVCNLFQFFFSVRERVKALDSLIQAKRGPKSGIFYTRWSSYLVYFLWSSDFNGQ